MSRRGLVWEGGGSDPRLQVVRFDDLLRDVYVVGGVPDDWGRVGATFENRRVAVLLGILLQKRVDLLGDALESLLGFGLGIVLEVFRFALELLFLVAQILYARTFFLVGQFGGIVVELFF